ncbi:hypothetical protein GOP47_0026799 [Adiantum capillus-veneris]|nr:hypothetical protein GOP47_0026799 [Adiantum capillus-veneris]
MVRGTRTIRKGKACAATSKTLHFSSSFKQTHGIKKGRTNGQKKPNKPPLALQAKATFPKPSIVLQIQQPEDSTPKLATKKQKRTKLSWTEKDMEKALLAREQGLSLQKCSMQFGMRKSAIANWEEGRSQKSKRGPETTLTFDEEEALLHWIFQKCESRHGLSILDVKLKVAEICQTRHTLFTNGIPGRSWWEGFRGRHPQLVFRVSEGLDQSRAIRFWRRPEIFKTLHKNLKALYDENKYPPSNIWNVDETGFQGSRDKGMKILAKKGTKSLYGITCDSREWMTVLCCVSVDGHAIPSYYIFKGSRLKNNYIEDCEPWAAMAMQKKHG